MRERLIQLLSRYFDIGDSYTYNLTRVKTAFAVGTVDLDDFEEYTEGDVANLADYLLEEGAILPQVKVGQTVWYINRVPGTSIHSAKIVEIYYNGEFFAVRVETKLGSCFDVMFEKNEIFLTREDAEAALKARENNA